MGRAQLDAVVGITSGRRGSTTSRPASRSGARYATNGINLEGCCLAGEEQPAADGRAADRRANRPPATARSTEFPKCQISD